VKKPSALATIEASNETSARNSKDLYAVQSGLTENGVVAMQTRQYTAIAPGMPRNSAPSQFGFFRINRIISVTATNASGRIRVMA
jgi:hypothetical protein